MAYTPANAGITPPNTGIDEQQGAKIPNPRNEPTDLSTGLPLRGLPATPQQVKTKVDLHMRTNEETRASMKDIESIRGQTSGIRGAQGDDEEEHNASYDSIS